MDLIIEAPGKEIVQWRSRLYDASLIHVPETGVEILRSIVSSFSNLEGRDMSRHQGGLDLQPYIITLSH